MNYQKKMGDFVYVDEQTTMTQQQSESDEIIEYGYDGHPIFYDDDNPK